jgi:septal ring factor EnvC (AmiA/AmiB activator)
LSTTAFNDLTPAPTRRRPDIPTILGASVLAAALLGFVAMSALFHNQLQDTQATLAQTQADLAQAQADRDNANSAVAQLNSERDQIKGDLDKANASVSSLQNQLNTATTDRDQAQHYTIVLTQLMMQAGTMLSDLGDFEKIENQQHDDLLRALNDAYYANWTSYKVDIGHYNDRQPLEGQKALTVLDDYNKLKAFIDSHPELNQAAPAPALAH